MATIWSLSSINLFFSNTDDDNYIHLGIKLTNLYKSNGNAYKLKLNFRKLMDSIFLDSIEKPVHFIFMTDRKSVPKIKVGRQRNREGEKELQPPRHTHPKKSTF